MLIHVLGALVLLEAGKSTRTFVAGGRSAFSPRRPTLQLQQRARATGFRCCFGP
jgi:hypothetical protein